MKTSSGGTVLSTSTFRYDAFDHRIEKNENGTITRTIYDGGNAWGDFNSSNAETVRYLYGRGLDQLYVRVDASNAINWYLTDYVGSVRDVVSTTGAVLDHVKYDSFGNILTETAPAQGDRFKYTSREYDASTNLYYYRARYYDSATGRFLNQDPLKFAAGDANLYRYVGGRVTLHNDPSGLIDGERNQTGGNSGNDQMSSAEAKRQWDELKKQGAAQKEISQAGKRYAEARRREKMARMKSDNQTGKNRGQNRGAISRGTLIASGAAAEAAVLGYYWYIDEAPTQSKVLLGKIAAYVAQVEALSQPNAFNRSGDVYQEGTVITADGTEYIIMKLSQGGKEWVAVKHYIYNSDGKIVDVVWDVKPGDKPWY